MAAAASSKTHTKPSGGLLMILSPAKTLDMSPLVQNVLEPTNPTRFDLQQEIVSKMKNKKEKDLVKLLSVSANLAKKTREYWSNFELDPTKRDASETKPCIYAFSGAAYQGLQASTCTPAAMEYLQHNLRIVDACFGLLAPHHLIQPYRLEMSTKLLEHRKLSQTWKPILTKALSQELTTKRILVNLASDEYANAIDFKALPEGTKIIKVVFRENGRVVAIHAKRARGLMVRYLAEQEVESVEQLREFHLEGYKFVPEESNNDTVVFDRKGKQQPKKRSSTKKSSPPKKKQK